MKSGAKTLCFTLQRQHSTALRTTKLQFTIKHAYLLQHPTTAVLTLFLLLFYKERLQDTQQHI